MGKREAEREAMTSERLLIDIADKYHLD